MKRLFFALLIMLFAVVPCSAVDGSVSLANIRLSLVNGTAFVDFSAADTLTKYLGWKLIISDSAGKKAVGYIKAAGSGETYTDLVTGDNSTFASDTGWWTRTGGWQISGGNANITASTGYFRKDGIMTAGALYKLTHTVTNSGGDFAVYLSGGRVFGLVSETATYYATATNANIAYYKSISGDATIDNVTLSRVLTPSTTGVTIVSTRGGTTYNWTSIETGFNYNDPNGYTYKLTAPATGGFGFGFGFGF